MQLFLDIYSIAWSQDTLTDQYCSMSDVELLDLINTKYKQAYPNEEVVPFTIDDLYSLKLNFNFSFTLNELNCADKFSLLQAWFDNAQIAGSSISADVNKTSVKAKISDGDDISIASVVYHDSLIIK
jgi:hypothetical protein